MGIIGFRRRFEKLPDQHQPDPLGSRSTFFLGPRGIRTIGQAQEMDTALPIVATPGGGAGPVRTIAQALEADTAQVMKMVKGAPPAVSAPNRSALATYTLEVAWSAHARGAFVIGSSTIAGPDVLTTSPFDVSFTGVYDNISSLFRGGKITRGRNDERTRIVEGRANITVRDPTGLLNPENAAGPLFSLLGALYQSVRLRGRSPSGTTFPIYYGYIERIEWKPLRRSPGAGIATLICRDLLLWLSEARPVIASTGPTTSGAAIGLMLDAVGLIDPTARSLGTGDIIPNFSTDGSKSVLQLIGELLQAERGVFYVNAAGVAVYEDRLTRTLRDPVAVIAHEMRAAIPTVDHSRLRNRVRVKRTQNGYIATATNDTLRQLIGDRDLEDIETPYLASDGLADSLAGQLLAQLSTPVEPLRDLTIDNRTEALLTQCLAREFGDVVTLSAAGASIVASDYLIESLEHSIDPRRGSHSVKWLLSKHGAISPFVIGESVLVAEGADGDVLVY